MNNITKHYIGNIGWSGNTKHIIIAEECNCEKFEGTHSHTAPYAVCKPNIGRHYSIGPVTQIKHVEPTRENVTCKSCFKVLTYWGK